MSAKYELLPTEPTYSPKRSSSSGSVSPTYPPPYEPSYYSHFENDVEDSPMRRPRARREPLPAYDSDPRFRMRTPSPYVRAALLAFVFFLFWLAFATRKALWVAGGRGMGKGPVHEVDPSY